MGCHMISFTFLYLEVFVFSYPITVRMLYALALRSNNAELCTFQIVLQQLQRKMRWEKWTNKNDCWENCWNKIKSKRKRMQYLPSTSWDWFLIDRLCLWLRWCCVVLLFLFFFSLLLFLNSSLSLCLSFNVFQLFNTLSLTTISIPQNKILAIPFLLLLDPVCFSISVFYPDLCILLSSFLLLLLLLYIFKIILWLPLLKSLFSCCFPSFAFYSFQNELHLPVITCMICLYLLYVLVLMYVCAIYSTKNLKWSFENVLLIFSVLIPICIFTILFILWCYIQQMSILL